MSPLNLHSLMVVGTDTEVGKTLVSGALILKIRELGLRVAGFKPVVAGLTHGQNEDLIALQLTLDPTDNIHFAEICPYLLSTPASPHISAKLESVDLELDVMLKSYQTLKEKVDVLIVEGAGGLLVPISDTADLGDFAQQIGLDVILVVAMRLGCLNHALLTAESIRSRGLKIAGWVANTMAEEMPYFEENLATLERRLSAPLLGVIPSLPSNLAKTPYVLEALTLTSQFLSLP